MYYDIFFTTHSLLRYIVILLLVWSFLSSVLGMSKSIEYKPFNAKINKWSVLVVHIQLILGFILYFVSPNVKFVEGFMKDKELRYWGIEHLIMMLLAIILITIGNARAKRAKTDKAKHKNIVIFFGISLLIIVVAILQSGRPLF